MNTNEYINDDDDGLTPEEREIQERINKGFHNCMSGCVSLFVVLLAISIAFTMIAELTK